MAALDPDTLARLSSLRRQLRDIPGLKEQRPGRFVVGSTLIAELVAKDGTVRAEVHNAGTGSAALTSYDVEVATEARRFVDEMKRRVVRALED